nr:zinc finger, CCHC-type [Tanacetum cinerariifolium]
MDTMTAQMCHEGVDQTEFARVLMEFDVEKGFKDVIDIHYMDKQNKPKGKKSAMVEYQWKTGIYSHFKVFGHYIGKCDKRPRTVEEIEMAKKKKELSNENMTDRDRFRDDKWEEDRMKEKDLQNEDEEDVVDIRDGIVGMSMNQKKKQKEVLQMIRDENIQKRIVANQPWALIGDFNATLNVQEHFAGGSSMTNDMHDCYTDASWISNTKDNSSTSGWVFLLGSGVIPWASKKKTCITGSTMESEFVALQPLMYNGKPRHLGVRHNMIRKLIMNGVISIEFVRSQQNLADHLTKGLDRDLVIKSAEGMAESYVLQIIPRMCLEPADKEDEVVNFLMVNFFEKVLSRSMNKEEPPM